MDINSRDGLRLKATNKSYETYLKKFAIFLNINYVSGEFLPKDVYSDKNICEFLCAHGELCGYKVIVLIKCI